MRSRLTISHVLFVSLDCFDSNMPTDYANYMWSCRNYRGRFNFGLSHISGFALVLLSIMTRLTTEWMSRMKNPWKESIGYKLNIKFLWNSNKRTKPDITLFRCLGLPHCYHCWWSNYSSPDKVSTRCECICYRHYSCDPHVLHKVRTMIWMKPILSEFGNFGDIFLRSVYSWDIVVQKIDGKIFLDKRDNTEFGKLNNYILSLSRMLIVYKWWLSRSHEIKLLYSTFVLFD